MKVDIWSDIVCPFCYIGKRKFEQALQQFDGKENVTVEWRSFQLDPAMEYVAGQSVHEYLGKRKGGTTADGKQMNDNMAAIAKEVGLEYDFENAIINNTLDAHRLLHLSKKAGLQNEMKESLFAAYYTQGKNIGDLDTLIELGTEVGLDAAEIRTTLESNLYANEVEQDQMVAQQIGATGVPFFVFDNKYAVSGAQPAEVFKQVMDKIKEEQKPTVVRNEGEGCCTAEGVCN